jgi:hypothetical protein
VRWECEWVCVWCGRVCGAVWACVGTLHVWFFVGMRGVGDAAMGCSGDDMCDVGGVACLVCATGGFEYVLGVSQGCDMARFRLW